MSNVYIVDDDPIFTFVMRRLIEICDFCEIISTFANGELALNDLKSKLNKDKKMPSVIFLDINMPVMDGWQFLDQFALLPLKDEIIIYVVSSTINLIDHEKCKSYNSVRELVVKPLTIEKLNEIKNEVQNGLS